MCGGGGVNRGKRQGAERGTRKGDRRTLQGIDGNFEQTLDGSIDSKTTYKRNSSLSSSLCPLSDVFAV